jgi:hypothetical protein
MMLEQGALPQKKETKDVPNPDIHKGPIPQHRSSPPPPPPKKETKTEEVSWDDLDETEKVLCRSYKMSPKEFKEFQELNPEDVAESTIGQKEGA